MRPGTPRSPDNAFSDSDAPARPSARSDQQNAPGAEPLLAGTLALMTSYAQPCGEEHSALILQKIIENLGRLATHPAASSSFQATVTHLGVLWMKALEAVRSKHLTSQATQAFQAPQAPEAASTTAPAAAQPSWPPRSVPGSALWHVTPETVQ